MFKGNIDNYINWLICSNNKPDVKKVVEKIERERNENKPIATPESLKTEMFNNICDYCKKPIYQGDEICTSSTYAKYKQNLHVFR